VFHIGVSAQDAKNSPSQKQQWKRLEGENKEFSATLPADFDVLFVPESFNVLNPKDWQQKTSLWNMHSIRAYENGAAIIIERYQAKKAKTALKYMLASLGEMRSRTKPPLPSLQERDFTIGSFDGRHLVKEQDDYYFTEIYLASEKYVYYIGAGARDKNNPALAAMLAHLEADGKQIVQQPRATLENIAAETESISALQTTPLGLYIEKMKLKEIEEEQKKSIEAGKTATSNGSSTTGDKRLLILNQPRPGYTEDARRNNIQGKLFLRVFFGANGRISRINAISGLSYGLTEKSIIAARRILFLPAEKDGKPISTAKIVEYRFTIY
jgi:hypothetical protein